MKISNKRELQQITINHWSNINSKDFINIYRKCTGKPQSELKKQRFFVDEWLRDPAFQGWLSKNKGNTKVRCTYFHKAIELSSSKCLALIDHAKGKKDIAIVDKKNFFKPKSKPTTEESTESSGETMVSNE